MKYTEISKAHRDLKKVPYDETNGSKNDAYWTAQEAFKVQLKHAMQDDELLRKLTKPQLVQMIAWCSSYRPIEPHVVLSILSKLAA